MAKKFNITGRCYPAKHYMADVSKKMAQIYTMVEEGDYFIINRPRQYGKTTTLFTLSNMLLESGEYLVFNTSFEGLGDSTFQDEAKFSEIFVLLLAELADIYAPELSEWLHKAAPKTETLKDLSRLITDLIKKTDKKVVLMIDEVDKSSNNQLFISFLAMLRQKYLAQDIFGTFHAVVLAGVHDVKSLKLKIRPDEEQKYNSPWNIAAEFKVDMNFNPSEIKPMLDDYVSERGVKMDTQLMSERLFYYTSGYPFLVCKLCKMLDEDILPTKEVKEWTERDLEKAVPRLVKESNTNFDSLIKNLENNKDLYEAVYSVAIDGDMRGFSIHNPTTNLGFMYGIFVNENGLAIHNRIYREVIVNYMTDKMHALQLSKGVDFGSGYRNADKSLNMELILTKFQAFMREQYSKKDRDFLERNGRLVFLAFVKPILNGAGYDFKEPQISEERRLDVVLTYFEHKYIAELKIWRGQEAHEEGLLQLADYLDRQGLTEGYLLIFDHSSVKTWQTNRVVVKGKNIFMAWV